MGAGKGCAENKQVKGCGCPGAEGYGEKGWLWAAPLPIALLRPCEPVRSLKLPFGARSGLAFGVKKNKKIQMGSEISDVGNSRWLGLRWELN